MVSSATSTHTTQARTSCLHEASWHFPMLRNHSAPDTPSPFQFRPTCHPPVMSSAFRLLSLSRFHAKQGGTPVQPSGSKTKIVSWSIRTQVKTTATELAANHEPPSPPFLFGHGKTALAVSHDPRPRLPRFLLLSTENLSANDEPLPRPFLGHMNAAFFVSHKRPRPSSRHLVFRRGICVFFSPLPPCPLPCFVATGLWCGGRCPPAFTDPPISFPPLTPPAPPFCPPLQLNISSRWRYSSLLLAS